MLATVNEYRHDVDDVDLPRGLVFEKVETTLAVSAEGVGFEYDLIEEDLLESFSLVGDVKRIRLYEGGFATVTFRGARDARAAMDLNGAPLDDRLGMMGAGGGTMRVQWGVPAAEEKVRPGSPGRCRQVDAVGEECLRFDAEYVFFGYFVPH